RLAVPHPRRAAPGGGRAGRGGVRAAGARAAPAPPAGRVLDEEPRGLDREGAPPARLRAAGRPRRGRRAHRRVLPRGGLAVSDRAARLVLAAAVLALCAGVWGVRLPQFWGDGATYHSMAWSLAEDGDLRYEAKDLLRVQREM